MAKQVRSVFRVRLEPGETKFKVKLPYQSKSLVNAKYSFDSINIIPDFYARKAVLYHFDPKSDETLPIQYETKLVFSYGDDVYMRHEYTQPENNMTMANLIKSINDHFELYKPASFTDARFFIDWAHRQENQTDVSPEEFYKTSAPLFYEEEYDENKHWNALPISARRIFGVNNFLFPTTDDAEVLADIRLRIWAGPNTSIAFSSDNILQALGFKPEEMGKRGDKNRFHFQNAGKSGHGRKRPGNAPASIVRIGGGKSKIYVSTAANEIVTDPFALTTTRQRERSNVLLAEDLHKNLKKWADHYSMSFGLEYKENEKIFKFQFPVAENVKVKVKIPQELSQRLGYGQRDFIEKENVPEPAVVDDNTELEQKARTLVFDTGLTTITLDHRGNHYSYGVQDELMAVLYPRDPGILESRSSLYSSEIPSIHGDELTFSIWRFSEDNKTIPLSWKCGAYVEGLLVGNI